MQSKHIFEVLTPSFFHKASLPSWEECEPLISDTIVTSENSAQAVSSNTFPCLSV